MTVDDARDLQAYLASVRWRLDGVEQRITYSEQQRNDAALAIINYTAERDWLRGHCDRIEALIATLPTPIAQADGAHA